SIWPTRLRNTARLRLVAAIFATVRNSSGLAVAPGSELGGISRHQLSSSKKMSDPIFLRRSVGLSLDEIASLTDATIVDAAAKTRRIKNIAPLDRAGPDDLTFFESRNFASAAAATHAGACLCTQALAKDLPNTVTALTVREPYRAFVLAARALFPQA